MTDVLVVEDESAIAQFVAASLSAAGLRPRTCATARAADEEIRKQAPDLVILDLGLPDEDGVSFIARSRASLAAPVLVLSARTQEAEKIAALDAGADDYLTKPFGVGELIARVRVLLRRHAKTNPQGTPQIAFGEVQIDLANRVVTRAGQDVHLTPIEYRLLAVLIAHRGKVMTHRELLREVWGPAHSESSHYLRVYMGHLRHKLEADPAQPSHLMTEVGVGYRFVG